MTATEAQEAALASAIALVHRYNTQRHPHSARSQRKWVGPGDGPALHVVRAPRTNLAQTRFRTLTFTLPREPGDFSRAEVGGAK